MDAKQLNYVKYCIEIKVFYKNYYCKLCKIVIRYTAYWNFQILYYSNYFSYCTLNGNTKITFKPKLKLRKETQNELFLGKKEY